MPRKAKGGKIMGSTAIQHTGGAKKSGHESVKVTRAHSHKNGGKKK